MRPLCQEPSSPVMTEPLSAAEGGSVTNHLPTRPAEQQKVCRAIKLCAQRSAIVVCAYGAYAIQPVQVQVSKGYHQPPEQSLHLLHIPWRQRVGQRCSVSKKREHPPKQSRAQPSRIIVQMFGNQTICFQSKIKHFGATTTRSSTAANVHRTASKCGTGGRSSIRQCQCCQPTISSYR